MTTQLIEEIKDDKSKLKRYRERLKILSKLERLELPNIARVKTDKLKRPPFKTLKKQYEILTENLNRKFPECIQKTSYERHVLNLIQKHSNLKFYKSVWIGNRNVDLFSPAIGALYLPTRKGQERKKQTLARGIVIEIDGGIHNHELKIKKDESRNEFLKSLGIAVTVIENRDIEPFESQLITLVKQINQTTRLDQRARERVWRKIYATTLIYHASDETLAELYGENFLTEMSKVSKK